MLESSRADHLAFRAPGLDAAMAVFENCTAPERGELRWVAHHLFFGLKDRTLRDRQATQVAGLPAVRTRLEAALEGRPVELEAVTLRHGACLYDLVYAAPPDRFADGRAAFEAFLGSFAPRPGR